MDFLENDKEQKIDDVSEDQEINQLDLPVIYEDKSEFQRFMKLNHKKERSQQEQMTSF